MKRKEIEEMKVLNIAQPNAHNVIFNGKNVENRNMPSSFRGTIAIYASKTIDKDRFEDQMIKKEECSFGCIIGFVDVVDCITEIEVDEKTKEWFSGPYGYVLENIVSLEKPIEVVPPKGAVTWWTLDGEKLGQCLNQLPPNFQITPITEAPKKDTKKPRNASTNRLIPSDELSTIIGSKPISFKQAIGKFCEYLEENEIEQEETKGKVFIFGDKNLIALHKKDKFSLEESVEVIKANLFDKN